MRKLSVALNVTSRSSRFKIRNGLLQKWWGEGERAGEDFHVGLKSRHCLCGISPHPHLHHPPSLPHTHTQTHHLHHHHHHHFSNGPFPIRVIKSPYKPQTRPETPFPRRVRATTILLLHVLDCTRCLLCLSLCTGSSDHWRLRSD